MSAIPEPQLREIRDSASAAYYDAHWNAGDSRELAATLLRLALENWRAGYELGLQHGRDE